MLGPSLRAISATTDRGKKRSDVGGEVSSDHFGHIVVQHMVNRNILQAQCTANQAVTLADPVNISTTKGCCGGIEGAAVVQGHHCMQKKSMAHRPHWGGPYLRL